MDDFLEEVASNSQYATEERSALGRIAEVEKNLETETENRKKTLSQKKSSEVRLGHISETIAPFLESFELNPEECSFLGKPIDYISFSKEAIVLFNPLSKLVSGSHFSTFRAREISGCLCLGSSCGSLL